MKKTIVILGLVAVCLCGCPTGPYNTLIWNRDNVQANNGKTDTGPWFEWWYYKVVLPDTGDAFYFLYGVVNPWDTGMTDPASRAYVGFGNFVAKESITQDYPVADFTAAYDKTDVTIAGQHATDTAIVGSLADGGISASWNIQISNLWDFNAMGWAMFVPDLTNIYWYPAQAAALFSGQIVYNGKTYTVDKVPGYQDRNWGRSFPAWWAWIVANHFDGHPDAILAAGGGKPTLLDAIHNIQGLAIGLSLNGQQYEFRPNDGDLERLTINFGTWEVTAVNRDGYKIEIEASAPCDSFMDLIFATPQGDNFHDFETLTGNLTLRLYKLELFHYKLLATLQSDFAGIEYGSAGVTAADCHAKDYKILFDNF